MKTTIKWRRGWQTTTEGIPSIITDGHNEASSVQQRKITEPIRSGVGRGLVGAVTTRLCYKGETLSFRSSDNLGRATEMTSRTLGKVLSQYRSRYDEKLKQFCFITPLTKRPTRAGVCWTSPLKDAVHRCANAFTLRYKKPTLCSMLEGEKNCYTDTLYKMQLKYFIWQLKYHQILSLNKYSISNK